MAPSAPTLKLLGGNKICISWAAVSHTPAVTHYAISVYEGSRLKYFDSVSGTLVEDTSKAAPVKAITTSITFSCAIADVAYSAQVAASSEVGWSDYSVKGNAVTIKKPMAPSAPTLKLLGGNKICISWAAVSHTPAVTHYAISVYEGSRLKYFDSVSGTLVEDTSKAAPVKASTTSITFSGAVAGVAYRAKVAASSESGWSEYSAGGCAVIIEEHVLPATPSKLMGLDPSLSRCSTMSGLSSCTSTSQALLSASSQHASPSHQSVLRLSSGDNGRRIPLGTILFSQDSIKGVFRDGSPLAKMRRELQTGLTSLEDVPTITVVPYSGLLYSVDNRRLWVFKQVFHPSCEIPVVLGYVDSGFLRKLTTCVQGRSVARRGSLHTF